MPEWICNPAPGSSVAPSRPPPCDVPDYSYAFMVADDFDMPVEITDANGNPFDCSGGQLFAEFYPAGRSQPLILTAFNGGMIDADLVHGKATFLVGSAITADFRADAPKSRQTPTRLQVIFIDSEGHRRSRKVFLVRVADPRTDDLSMLPQNMTGMIVLATVQGDPGPTVSVNGKTGPVQTITAHDVGAYTAAETDAKLAAAAAASVITALIFS